MSIHGNTCQWDQLERDFPEVAILQGPRGVGKFTGAAGLAGKLAGVEACLLMQNVTVQDVRELIQWFRYSSDSHKIAVLEPGKCHPNVLSLLKDLLERLPPRAHVWLVDSYVNPLPRGILGRGFLYEFDLLGETEMRAFLQEAETITLDTDYVVTLGSADLVMEMNQALQLKPAVANWIRSVEESNRDLLLTCSGGWGARHTSLLCAEIEAQLGGGSLIQGLRFRRVSRDKQLRGLTLLHDGSDAQLSAIGIGLLMMP